MTLLLWLAVSISWYICALLLLYSCFFGVLTPSNVLLKKILRPYFFSFHFWRTFFLISNLFLIQEKVTHEMYTYKVKIFQHQIGQTSPERLEGFREWSSLKWKVENIAVYTIWFPKKKLFETLYPCLYVLCLNPKN